MITLFDGVTRRIPGTVWVRVVVGGKVSPGHEWLYGGIVRRDTFTVRGWGLVVMVMPRYADPA